MNDPSDPARRKDQRRIVVHPLVVRLTHWVNAFAMLCMVTSGWGIYNASPLFGFRFPHWMTLGGWLGGAIAWHLAVMWLLVGNALVYLAYGIAGRHFRRRLLPLRAAAIRADAWDALRFRLRHRPGVYNAVQRLLYVVVLALGVAAVASGLALWKPVQLHPLTALLGGYELCRRLHFLAMGGIVAFTIIHLLLVVLVPRSLPPMITGRIAGRTALTEVEP